MSMKSLAWAMSLPDVSPLEKLVTIAMADNDGIDGPCASFQQVQAFCNVSPEEVKTAIEKLSKRFGFRCAIENDDLSYELNNIS